MKIGFVHHQAKSPSKFERGNSNAKCEQLTNVLADDLGHLHEVGQPNERRRQQGDDDWTNERARNDARELVVIILQSSTFHSVKKTTKHHMMVSTMI